MTNISSAQKKKKEQQRIKKSINFVDPLILVHSTSQSLRMVSGHYIFQFW